MGRTSSLILSVLLIQGCSALQPKADQAAELDLKADTLAKICIADQTIVDPSIAVELQACYTKLKDSERGNVLVSHQMTELRAQANDLKSAKLRIEDLKKKNNQLKEEVKKKDEALRRLKEVTLGN